MMFKILRGYMVNDKFLAETSTGFLNDKTYTKTIVSSEGRTCKLTKKKNKNCCQISTLSIRF